MAKYRPVQSILRAIEVLSAMNRHNGASVQLISQTTGVHRTTVYRILETFRHAGYVRKRASDDTYRLELKVRQLSEGFDDEAWVSTIAAPLLRKLQREVLWPTNVATLDYDAMVVRESTHRFSPFSIHNAVVGQRLPLLRTAMGRAYFAFCRDAERSQLLEIIRASRGADAALAGDRTGLERLVRTTRQNGYAFNNSERERNIAAIALPIVHEERVFACMNLVFFASAMSIPLAAEKYLPAMREAIDAMIRQLPTETDG